jgi:hypothetical protein
METITELKTRRDNYIIELKRSHKNWDYRRIAAEVRKVYGECSHTHVGNVLKEHESEWKQST